MVTFFEMLHTRLQSFLEHCNHAILSVWLIYIGVDGTAVVVTVIESGSSQHDATTPVCRPMCVAGFPPGYCETTHRHL